MDISVNLDSGGRLTVRGVDDDGAIRNADAELVDAEGQRWGATVMTAPEVERLMNSWRSSGECQAGAFFRVPDLIIVRDGSQDAVVRVFSELNRTGEHREEMTMLSDD